jgi:hypothetical protein
MLPYCMHFMSACPPAGKEKEVSARSCHQEVLRQCKAAWAAAAAAQQTSSSSSQQATVTGGSSSTNTTSDLSSAAAASSLGAAEQAAVAAGLGAGCVATVVMPSANGYLAAAELVLQLNLPGLAAKLLELAAGERLLPDTSMWSASVFIGGQHIAEV